MYKSYKMLLVTKNCGVLRGNVVYRTIFINIKPKNHCPHPTFDIKLG